MSEKVYEIVTQKIIDMMETGKIPWKKPWNSNLPMNLKSKKEYRGINSFLLSLSEYSSPYWLTYDQAVNMGGCVKKGEKSRLVVFWKFLKSNKVNKDGTVSEKTIPLLRYFNVFNVEQCERIEVPVKEVKEVNKIEKCENIVNQYDDGPIISNNVVHGHACYIPSLDTVSMPPIKDFENSEKYYSTLFHELTHSTGSITRLDRGLNTSFGNHEYSFEELVAEMGAAFLCGITGIENNSTIENSAAYIQTWIKKFKEDPKMLIKAASKASKAVDWIMNERGEEKETVQE